MVVAFWVVGVLASAALRVVLWVVGFLWGVVTRLLSSRRGEESSEDRTVAEWLETDITATSRLAA